jgi:hypothetical protein
MSSFTFADHRLGGRLTAACDAIGAGHLNRAAGILGELADELNVEATQAGLLSEEAEAPKVEIVAELPFAAPSEALLKLSVAQPVDLQMCARGVHSYGPSDPVSGWRECATCGNVNVAPPENSGPIDIDMRDGRW